MLVYSADFCFSGSNDNCHESLQGLLGTWTGCESADVSKTASKSLASQWQPKSGSSPHHVGFHASTPVHVQSPPWCSHSTTLDERRKRIECTTGKLFTTIFFTANFAKFETTNCLHRYGSCSHDCARNEVGMLVPVGAVMHVVMLTVGHVVEVLFGNVVLCYVMLGVLCVVVV